MIYKEDWEKSRNRWNAWWNREVLDRPTIWITAPKANVKRRMIKQPEDLIDRWTNVEYILETTEEKIRCTFWGGEAVPNFWPNLGPNFFSAILGSELHFAEDTSWVEPFINDWKNFHGLHFDPENKWWKLMSKIIKEGARKGKDRFLVAIPDLHGGGDAIAGIRGTENLCIDLIQYPEKILECKEFMKELWFNVYEELYKITTSEGQEGTYSWLGWAPGKTCPLQEDLLALISPDMFSNFFIDIIKEQVNYLDYSIFHLDGPECLPHLDLLLEIPGLHGIQWEPGDGHRPMTRWISLLKKIQNAGKVLWINIDIKELDVILSELSPNGLMVVTEASSQEEAEGVLSRLKMKHKK